MLAYCAGMFSMVLAVWLSNRLRLKRPLLADFGGGDLMKQSAIACFLVGAVLTVVTANSGSGSVGSALREVNRFPVMAILFATVWQMRRTGGRSSTNWIFWVSAIWLFFQGLVTFSKEGMFLGPVTWLIATVALGYNFSWKQIAGGVLGVFLVVYYLVPYSQYVRNFRVQSRAENIAIGFKYLGDLNETRRLYNETQQGFDISNEPHLFGTAQGFMDRLNMLAFDDALVDNTEQGNVFGLLPTLYSYANVVPHVIWKDKPEFLYGNVFGRQIGVIDENNTTTGISFSPTGDAFHEARWFGVLVVWPLVAFLFFVINDSLVGGARESPWALLTIALVSHTAPEGLMAGTIFLTTYNIIAVLFVAGFVRYAVPAMVLFLTGGRTGGGVPVPPEPRRNLIPARFQPAASAVDARSRGLMSSEALTGAALLRLHEEEPPADFAPDRTMNLGMSNSPQSVRGNLFAPASDRAVPILLLAVAAVFLALHFVHLSADFPNQSRWMDWSKYTDEGWYGDAAIRHFQLGHWYVPGDFNPAAALPVWPALEGLVFLFTGVSLVAARALSVAVFAGILVASWFLLRDKEYPLGSYAAPAAVLLLALNPFCFVFTRLAIIEPLLVLLMLLALLAARRVRPLPEGGAMTPRALIRLALSLNLGPILALGLLLPLMILSKTTAIFLFPAVGWMLFAAAGYRLRSFLPVAVAAGTLALALWLSWFLLIVRPHFLADYRYLFSANAYTGITRENAFQVLLGTVKYGTWIGRPVYLVACASILLALLNLRRLRSHPEIPALLLWTLGYAAFLAYHNNLQPRYYLVVAVPLTLLAAIVPERLILQRLPRPAQRRIGVALCAVLVVFIAVPDARQTLSFVRHPQYTLLTAARQVHDYIAADRQADPTHSPLVLSISGSDLSLMTGLPSICDDFGTLELPDRVKKYRPGWYVAWNQIDDDKMDAMTPLFQPVRVAAFPAMDDPDRNVLVLYRLDPPEANPFRRHARKPVPRSLRTRVGQQPSTTQLIH